MIIDFQKLEPAERYQWMVATVVPRPIAFVSTLSGDGTPNLAPFSYFNGVSSKPPVLSISIGRKRGGAPKDTLANVMATKELVVNVVPEEIGAEMVQCAGNYPPEESEFDASGLTPIASQMVLPPRVKECPISMECRLFQTVPVGEHSTLVLAEILLVHAWDEVLTDGRPDPAKFRPLARLGGEFYTPLGKIRKIVRPT